MGIGREVERGLTVLTNEFTAYRSLADECAAMFRSNYRDLHGPLRVLVVIASRLSAEIGAPVEYSIERVKDGDSPEKITARSQSLMNSYWK